MLRTMTSSTARNIAMHFDPILAAPFFTSALVQVAATLFSGIGNFFAENELKKISASKVTPQYSGVELDVPDGTQNDDILTPELKPERISTVYSWSRDVAMLLTNAVLVTAAIFATSSRSGPGMGILCLIWWIAVIAAVSLIIKKGVEWHRELRLRVWEFGPASLAIIICNLALVPLVGFGLVK